MKITQNQVVAISALLVVAFLVFNGSFIFSAVAGQPCDLKLTAPSTSLQWGNGWGGCNPTIGCTSNPSTPGFGTYFIEFGWDNSASNAKYARDLLVLNGYSDSFTYADYFGYNRNHISLVRPDSMPIIADANDLRNRASIAPGATNPGNTVCTFPAAHPLDESKVVTGWNPNSGFIIAPLVTPGATATPITNSSSPPTPIGFSIASLGWGFYIVLAGILVAYLIISRKLKV